MTVWKSGVGVESPVRFLITETGESISQTFSQAGVKDDQAWPIILGYWEFPECS